ncbi:hypothetical protein [Paracoccus sanguinis]|uniref:hypothetical protein n=1 Tax=Paracoccus sanguinis TaxID=1545044 RepID=UPI0014527538|nr:hypothetical protein [Paracoccus sanguinis]QJD17281.1 hypothetical protein HGN31_10660 [Paracoccus sanguinis]
MKVGLPAALTVHGTAYDLAHLAPFRLTLAGQAAGGRDLAVRVTFSSHVFSTAPVGAAHDFLDENGAPRSLCGQRFHRSLTLANDIRQIVAANAYSWPSRDRNQVNHLAVLPAPQAALLNGVHWVLFYYLYPSAIDDLDVEMSIRSCYQQPLNFQKHPRREKIRSLIKTAHFKNCRVPAQR